MHGMVLSDDQAQPDAADDWIDVFQQRGVWQLTREIVERWVARNSVFFGWCAGSRRRAVELLELGCGPGRHALGAATLGFRVLGIDRTRTSCARPRPTPTLSPRNAARLPGRRHVRPRRRRAASDFQAITHGGVMEHLDSAASIREALRGQLALRRPSSSTSRSTARKTASCSHNDDIFRQLWTAEEWVTVLAGLNIVDARTDLHPETNMTTIWSSRSGIESGVRWGCALKRPGKCCRRGETDATVTPARRTFILAACMAASFMAAVEATIIATAMPSIATSLGGFGLFAWVFSAYMLTQAATIPVYGRLADIYGRRRVFFAGACCSCWARRCAASPTPWCNWCCFAPSRASARAACSRSPTPSSATSTPRWSAPACRACCPACSACPR